MKKVLFLSLAALACGLAGCKGRNKNPVANVVQAAADKDLQGKWNAPCSAFDAKTDLSMAGVGDTLKGTRVQYEFQGANVYRRKYVYSDTNCTGQEVAQFIQVGEMKLDPNAPRATNDNAKQIDINWKKVLLKTPSEDALRQMTEKDVCSLQSAPPKAGRAANKEIDITDHSGDASCYGGTPGQVLNVYKINAKTLELGADSIKPLNQRPSRVTGPVYTKM